jgi:hypothetical protein
MSQAYLSNLGDKVPFDTTGHSLEEINGGVRRGIEEAQRVHAANDAKRGLPAEEQNWQVELDELSRHLQGLPSTKDAEHTLKALEDSVASTVKELEYSISLSRGKAVNPYMSNHELSEMARGIAEKEQGLRAYKDSTRLPLAKAKALVAECKEWNPKRKRYEELRARKADIQQATQNGKRGGFDRQEQLRRPGSENRLTF